MIIFKDINCFRFIIWVMETTARLGMDKFLSDKGINNPYYDKNSVLAIIILAQILSRIILDTVTNYKSTVRRRDVKSSSVVLHEKTKLKREEEKERNKQAALETEFILHIQ
jgi:uncharacterized protein YydD (DUF2326 family)